MHLGRKIKLLRVAKGLTQQELGDKVGKTRPLISSIEQTGVVNIYTLFDICKVLDVNPEDLDQLWTSQDGNFSYMNKSKSENEDLKAELQQLRNEIEILKELVESQKELITMLKAKKKVSKK